VPTIVNLMPSGKYLMEEFFYAGGLPVVLKRLGEAGLLHKDALTVSGQTMWDEVKDVRQLERGRDPARRQGAGAIGRHRRAARQPGAEGGGAEALGRHAASDGPPGPRRGVRGHRRLQGQDRRRGARHRRDLRDGAEELRPAGYPGMAEVGNMGLPPKVLRKGITDMVRISDARMSGTAYGTVVLHTSPEAARGGPLAVVRDGDMIELDVPNRRCTSTSPMPNWPAGSAAWKPRTRPPPAAMRGCTRPMSRAPIPAPTSISSRAAAATPSARTQPLMKKVASVGIGKIALDQHVPALAASRRLAAGRDGAQRNGSVPGCPRFTDARHGIPWPRGPIRWSRSACRRCRASTMPRRR
jgi:hypothetical protein